MSFYTVALFLHLVGVAGVFAGFGTWLFVVTALRRAGRVEQVRTLAGLIALADPVAVGSILVLAGAGLYMALSVWGPWTPWIGVATVGFLLIAPIGPLVIEPRMKRIVKLADTLPDGSLPPLLVARVRDPILGAALYTDIALLLGAVFLMTNKPPLAESMIVIAVAAVLGVASGLVLWWTGRRQRREAAAGISGA
ncbi:MAG TPA: hypothetical protein VJQ45_07865 [Ktedonobacterales bacterium]|nr:hypothetical protein [Ktedonobacterales bacterium]